MEVCSQCGARSTTAYSEAAGAVLCERCYGNLPSAREQRVEGIVTKLPGARRPKPDAYEQLVRDVWAWMERDGYCQSMGTAPPVLVGYCPRCGATMAARFLRRPHAEVRLICDGGCDEAAVGAALGRRDG